MSDKYDQRSITIAPNVILIALLFFVVGAYVQQSWGPHMGALSPYASVPIGNDSLGSSGTFYEDSYSAPDWLVPDEIPYPRSGVDVAVEA